MSPVTPQTVGDVLQGGYTVIDVLRGGMGVVYICYQAATELLYAIKTVRFDGPEAEVEYRVRKFKDEASRWIALSLYGRTPYIVSALAYDADYKYLILEFIDGLSLNRLTVGEIPIHPKHALAWADQIAEGMSVISSDFHLVHRDLKPQNVLVTARGLTAKITDFGIVKAFDEMQPTSTCVGTPVYMAPECYEGRADVRSDIYSYGALLQWMFTGRTTDAANGPRLPKSLTQIIRKCLERDPASRYENFAQIRRELAAVKVSDLPAAPKYDLCHVHELYSPAVPGESDGLPRCLLCAQQEDLRQKLRPLLSQSVTQRFTSPSTQLDLPAPPPPPPPDDRSPAPRRWTRRAAVIAIGIAAIGGAAALLRSHKGPLDVVAKDRCSEPGCKNPKASNAAFKQLASGQPNWVPWEPEFCEVHTPYQCTKCGRREKTLGACPSCGSLMERAKD